MGVYTSPTVTRKLSVSLCVFVRRFTGRILHQRRYFGGPLGWRTGMQVNVSKTKAMIVTGGRE
jgi:hypothetical protein